MARVVGFEVTDSDHALEVIEGGGLGKSTEEYIELLDESIREMFRVLKWDSWLSMVFAHKDPVYWDVIVKAAQKAGFEYVNTAVQPSTTPSLHKRKNPLKVLSGELVLNFRKVKSAGDDRDHASWRGRRSADQEHGGACDRPRGRRLDRGHLQRHGTGTHGAWPSRWFSNRSPTSLPFSRRSSITRRSVALVDSSEHARRYFHPLERPRPLLCRDYLSRVTREGNQVTFDEIVFTVIPNLMNGAQPTEQSILDVLREIGYSHDGKHWRLATEPTHDFRAGFAGHRRAPRDSAACDADELDHDEVIYRFAHGRPPWTFCRTSGRRSRRTVNGE